MVGSFPPPVHGMALVNAAIRDQIARSGLPPMITDLSGGSFSRSWHAMALRAFKSTFLFIKFVASLIAHRGGTLYMAVNGGYGQLYELPFVLLSRLLDARIFLHHHSFKYLDKYVLITDIMIRMAGLAATHVVLCEKMSNKLMTQYRVVNNIIKLSNAIFVDAGKDEALSCRTSLSTVGFVSNISYEKGIIDFFDTAVAVEARSTNIEWLVAGPFQDGDIEGVFQEHMKALKNVKYLGAVDGEKKEKFYSSIDVLLFPSLNEAEPLVIHEAMAHGIPVIARGKGCIAGMIPGNTGFVIDENDNFVEHAAKCLLSWISSPNNFEKVSRNALRQFFVTKEKHKVVFEELCSNIVNT